MLAIVLPRKPYGQDDILDTVHPVRKQVLNLGKWSGGSVCQKVLFIVSERDLPPWNLLALLLA